MTVPLAGCLLCMSPYINFSFRDLAADRSRTRDVLHEQPADAAVLKQKRRALPYAHTDQRSPQKRSHRDDASGLVSKQT